MVTRRLLWVDCLYQAAVLDDETASEGVIEWANFAHEDLAMCAALLDEQSAEHEDAKANFAEYMEEEDGPVPVVECETAEEVDRWLRTRL